MLRLKGAGAAVAAGLGLDYDVRLPKAAAITAFQNFSSPLRAVFGVFALLALGITGLLLYSLISVAVEERIREVRRSSAPWGPAGATSSTWS